MNTPPDIYQSFLKITGSGVLSQSHPDYVVVASWVKGDPTVFIGVFNPRLQKAKQDDPLAFHARVNDPAFPDTFGFYADFRYGDAHNRFFAAFPQYAWLKDVSSVGWTSVRMNAKMLPKIVDKKQVARVPDPCDADDLNAGS